jgi:hypothetical protein
VWQVLEREYQLLHLPPTVCGAPGEVLSLFSEYEEKKAQLVVDRESRLRQVKARQDRAETMLVAGAADESPSEAEAGALERAAKLNADLDELIYERKQWAEESARRAQIPAVATYLRQASEAWWRLAGVDASATRKALAELRTECENQLARFDASTQTVAAAEPLAEVDRLAKIAAQRLSELEPLLLPASTEEDEKAAAALFATGKSIVDLCERAVKAREAELQQGSQAATSDKEEDKAEKQTHEFDDRIAARKQELKETEEGMLRLCSGKSADQQREAINREYDSKILSALYSAIHRLPPTAHSALCLSGGGIRSATFALGVLQALARYGYLQNFTYLSTVSGGGYIGSWLSAWIHNRALGRLTPAERKDGTSPSARQLEAARTEVFTDLGRTPTNADPAGLGQGGMRPSSRPLDPEPQPLRHLRRYSNYLTPKLGYLSADTWTIVATVLRNLLLNWLIFVPALLLVLLIPRFVYAAMTHRLLSVSAHGQVIAFALGICAAGFALAQVLAGPAATMREQKGDCFFVSRVLMPLAFAGFAFQLAWAWGVQMALDSLPAQPWVVWAGESLSVLTGAACGLSAGLLAIGLYSLGAGQRHVSSERAISGQHTPNPAGRVLLLALVCTAAGALLGWCGGKTVEFAKEHTKEKHDRETAPLKAMTFVWRASPTGGAGVWLPSEVGSEAAAGIVVPEPKGTRTSEEKPGNVAPHPWGRPFSFSSSLSPLPFIRGCAPGECRTSAASGMRARMGGRLSQEWCGCC